MEEKERISEHIINYFLEGGDMDSTLDTWLKENESNKKDFYQYKRIWQESGRYTGSATFDENNAWMKIDEINQKKENKRTLLRNLLYTVSGVAASVLVIFVLSFWGILDKQSNVMVSMTADYGSRSEVVLPDGSTVKLNAGSNLVYSYNSKEKIREVDFRGEAFFDVSKSKTPFVVNLANGLKVKVWGTSFNLRAYTDDELVQASLVEGCIELNHDDDKLIMNAGEMAIFNKQTDQIERVSGILSHSYSWLENKLYMDNMSLSEVCKYLSRWYNVNITVNKKLGDSIHYNGVIQEETIIDILEALSRLSNISFQVKGKNISITSK
ncbi:FecR family protein [Parabacteroides timonensis]|uniref:FecR family protein n=1 Tax=Parabacteroides timonensis TaxID=1871013 RepID=UPI00094E3EFD|nr:FecR family protein [Parabacteroides timonensis]